MSKVIFQFLSIEVCAWHFDCMPANVVWKESTCRGHWGVGVVPKPLSSNFVVQFTVCRVTCFWIYAGKSFLVCLIYKTKEINTYRHVGICVFIFLKCTVSLFMSLKKFSSFGTKWQYCFSKKFENTLLSIYRKKHFHKMWRRPLARIQEQWWSWP